MKIYKNIIKKLTNFCSAEVTYQICFNHDFKLQIIKIKANKSTSLTMASQLKRACTSIRDTSSASINVCIKERENEIAQRT
jgi:hypothetical protein